MALFDPTKHLAGAPAETTLDLPAPSRLFLPLRTERFSFDTVLVSQGEHVEPGTVLARDSGTFGLPLLSPLGGNVDLEQADGHIVVADLDDHPEAPYSPSEHDPHIPSNLLDLSKPRALLDLGAWEFVSDAFTGAVPNPAVAPDAVVVVKTRLEPFLPQGRALLDTKLDSFVRGLEHIQTLLENYQPIYLVVPNDQSAFVAQIRARMRGYAWVKLVDIPRAYPQDHPALLARKLGHRASQGHVVWTLSGEGVLAFDRTLTDGRPALDRLITLAGGGVVAPTHAMAHVGYPIDELLEGRLADGPMRRISGGPFTGRPLLDSQLGLGSECVSITVLPEPTEREFLSFVRPGADRRSYSRCFAGSVVPASLGRVTASLRGEVRPCVSCGFCEEVCAAGLMPHHIHRCLYRDALEEAEDAGIDLCIGCGLCSYVCPSKIELRQQFLDGQERIRQELHPAEEGDG